MRRNTLILLIALILSTPTHAGWFSEDKVPELEREQRLKTEEQLKAAQGKIDEQQRSISRLHLTITVSVTSAVVLLIIGVALGSKVRRDGIESQ